MSQKENIKPIVLMDTSPLITLCAFSLNGKPIVNYLLPHCEFAVVESVAIEATANPTYKDSLLISQLLQSRQIKKFSCPTLPEKPLIDAYTKLGQGERDTIKLGISIHGTNTIFDDHLALVIATRFGLKPLLLLDFVVTLVQNGFLDKAIGLAIVDSISPRYSVPFIEHTRHKLKEVIT